MNFKNMEFRKRKVEAMKKIEIITRPENLDKVKKILAKNEYSGLSVSAIMGCGHQKGSMDEFALLNGNVNLLPKINIMSVVWDEDLEDILAEVQEALTTHTVGDGKIFVSTIDDVIRIRNGERGEKTL